MNVLFLSLLDINSLNEYGLYQDLLRQFINEHNHIYVLSPLNYSNKVKSQQIKNKYFTIIKVYTGNIQKTNIIEKGINTVLLESRYKQAIIKYLSNVKFDLILYPTPPITLAGVVKYVKARDHARTYLLLKDIFPQNALDIGMLNNKGVKAPIYRYFRFLERRLYSISDTIGCMSQANVKYLLKHNKDIHSTKVEICPNCIEPRDLSVDPQKQIEMRKKYGIPIDKTVFIYGGNLGKPQGIPFLLKCLNSQKKNPNVFFLIVGDGTEYGVIKDYFSRYQPKNMKLMSRLPKEDYDNMVGSCDVGMIFLDHRFTIPNFPSRILSYMQAQIPVLAVTDRNTDVGEVIKDGGFGWWCESNDVKAFHQLVKKISNSDLVTMGEKGYKYLLEHYDVRDTYQTIIKHMR